MVLKLAKRAILCKFAVRQKPDTKPTRSQQASLNEDEQIRIDLPLRDPARSGRENARALQYGTGIRRRDQSDWKLGAFALSP